MNKRSSGQAADLAALESRWFEAYGVNPDNADTRFEADLIRSAARAEWFFQRADHKFAEVEAEMFAAPNLLYWENTHHRTMSRLLTYRNTHLNAVAKHRKAIEDHRRNRATEFAQIQKLFAATLGDH